MIKKNSWVLIEKEILKPSERANNLPEETKKVPLKMWIKGYLLKDSQLEDEVEVKTLTNRIETGILKQVNPAYMHTYGKFIPELLAIDNMLKMELFGGDDNE
ncbi:MAG: 2-amino-4-ketopentanoate thiolase [Candidatus Izimaplasma sp.]|nr:2-amino-4-ketopentanoate thiolase [Candidatus Izimaplasma bacterium]